MEHTIDLQNEEAQPLPHTQPTNGEAQNVPPTVAPKKRKDRSAYLGIQAEGALLDEPVAKQMSIPIRKPGPVAYFMVCSEPDACVNEAMTLDGGMDGIYLIHRDLLNDPEVRRRTKKVALYVCQNHESKYFVWAIALGNIKTAAAAFKVVAEAQKRWVRVTWNAFAQAYDMEPVDPRKYPELASRKAHWEPEGAEILDSAFDDNSIDNINDPRLKKMLQGLR